MKPDTAFYAASLVATLVALGVLATVVVISQEPEPAPMIGGLTTEQHQMLVETHCYAQGGEWGPIHGCTMMMED